MEEFSSLFSMGKSRRFPVAPVLLIAIGVLFLLNNMDLLRFRDIARFWPVFLIAIGAGVLTIAVNQRASATLRRRAARASRPRAGVGSVSGAVLRRSWF